MNYYKMHVTKRRMNVMSAISSNFYADLVRDEVDLGRDRHTPKPDFPEIRL